MEEEGGTEAAGTAMPLPNGRPRDAGRRGSRVAVSADIDAVRPVAMLPA